eukprot:scaffold62598_cov45-Phaeocystis_antarctica.AAC.1
MLYTIAVAAAEYSDAASPGSAGASSGATGRRPNPDIRFGAARLRHRGLVRRPLLSRILPTRLA